MSMTCHIEINKFMPKDNKTPYNVQQLNVATQKAIWKRQIFVLQFLSSFSNQIDSTILFSNLHYTFLHCKKNIL
jgi:hypothetical protein